MRPELMTPIGGLTADTIEDAYKLLDIRLHRMLVESWTRMELALAFDWAWREHMHASDNRVKRREKPWFVAHAEAMAKAPDLIAAERDRVRQELAGGNGTPLRAGLHARAAVFDFLAERGTFGASAGRIMQHLADKDLHTNREVVHRWLEEGRHEGLVVNPDAGRWRATVLLVPGLEDELR